MTASLTIFMPCAGFGTRLRPLTSRIPKPMVPFQGKSAFKINWEKLTRLNPEKIICNSHHLPGALHREAEELGIEVFHEEKILGTGGCLTRLKQELSRTDHFLVHNGDIMHNIDLPAFLDSSSGSKHIADIAGINKPQINSLSVEAGGTLAGIKNQNSFIIPPENTSLTFTGIAHYKKEFLDYCTSMPEDLIYFWLAAMAGGNTIGVNDFSHSDWFDFGDPAGLWEASSWWMKESGNFSFQYSSSQVKPCVSNETSLKIEDPNLHNTVILESPENKSDLSGNNRIVGKDFYWEIS